MLQSRLLTFRRTLAIASSLLFIAGLVSGCASDKKYVYLGVPANEGKLITNDNSNGTRIRVTAVRDATNIHYENFKLAGKVESELEHEGYLYYAVREVKPVTDSSLGQINVPGSYLTVIERYRVQLNQ